MSDIAEGLRAARAAYGRHDWKTARDGFRALSEEGALSTDDLTALADAAWWLGDIHESIPCWEEAHGRYLEEGRVEEACMTAVGLAVTYFLRGKDALGSGWMNRAARLLEDVPQCTAHGYIAYILDVESSFDRGRPDAGIDAARRVQEIGRRFDDPNLIAAGLSGEGRMLLKAAETRRGMGLLDEAMVYVLAGKLSPDWAGNIYCNVIAACHELGDLRRMSEWTDATEEWLRTLPAAVLFSGICRVHRVQILQIHGKWEHAEREAAKVCEELAGLSVANVAEAQYQIGEVRRLRGELAEADEAYRQANQLGRSPQPGLALLLLAQGDTAGAALSIGAALVAVPGNRLARARLCAAQLEIALSADDTQVARQACDELVEVAAVYSSSGLEAMAARAQGAVLLAEGRPEDALPVLRDACRRWRELDAPYETARTCVLLAETYQALGDSGTAAVELDAAAVVFDSLGATVDARHLGALRGRPVRPGGLTDREVEVLALVASGGSNREIAQTLFISQKTVERHLSNIFTKLDARSRTQAARYAFEHGLVTSRPD